MTEEIQEAVDGHVHLVGNGSSGSGCWIRPRGWRRLLDRSLLWAAGLPQSALKEDLDELYVERILGLVQGSSLGRAVLLAQEQVYDEKGRPNEEAGGSFYVPNDYLLDTCRRHEEFLPGVSIHPGRPDAMEELERCLEAGAVLLKCLPNCHNIDPERREYTRFWERMAEAGLPLLAHTGGETVLPVVRPDLANPACLKRPLEIGVTVIAAHCGMKSEIFDRDYFSVFREMIDKYPNFYGDNSAFGLPFRERWMRECCATPVAERMVHGSDFPVPVFGHWLWVRRRLGWKSFRRIQRERNILERDCQLKRALGFPEETFTRIWTLLRRPG